MSLEKLDHQKPLLFIFAIGLIIFGSRLHLIDTFAVATPYWDDWGIGSMLNRFVTGSLDAGDLFRASNEHRLLFNKLLSLLIFDLNQEQWDPMISMVLNALIWTFTGTFLVTVISHQGLFSGAPIWPATVAFFWVFPISLVNLLWGVQTHNYTMIMFAVLGCWLVGGITYSRSWWFGIFCLLAACFTMAGGAFAAIAVATFYALGALVHKTYRKPYAINCLAALAVSLVGIYLILTQTATRVGEVEIDLLSSVITFLRAMSWPFSIYPWPSAVLFIPVVLLFILALRDENVFNSRLTKFAVCLYGFIFLVAIAIAFARGGGPSRRYMEFLSLSPVASLLALLLILRIKGAINSFSREWFPAMWLATLILSIPNLLYIANYTLEDRQRLKPQQEKYVRTFLATEDPAHLQDKLFREVPFPNIQMFEKALLKYKKSDILPYQIQAPVPLEHHPDQGHEKIQQSPFIKNGTIFPSKGTRGSTLFGENVFGSFRPSMGGMQAVGDFESLDFHLTRDYVMIPVLGYLGFPDLSLKLVDVFSREEYSIKPVSNGDRNAEAWQEIMIKVPKGYYRLEAHDQNPDLWFGFAAPRTVGKLSYWNQKLIENGHFLWKMGFFLLLLLSRKTISGWFFQKNVEPQIQMSSNTEL